MEFRRPTLSLLDTHEWRSSFSTNEQFYQENSDILSRMRFSTTFSPEQVQYLCRKLGIVYSDRLLFSQLEKIISEWGIDHIRFSLRWNSIEKVPGKIDFKLFESLFQYCIELGATIGFAGGPTQAPRYPEQHPPSHVLKEAQNQNEFPKKRSVITADSYLSKRSLLYYEQLMDEISQSLTTDQLPKVTEVLLENEPFFKYGEWQWALSEGHLENVLLIAEKYMPETTSFTINSSEHRHVKRIVHFIEEMQDKYPHLDERFTVGMNYYYHAPWFKIAGREFALPKPFVDSILIGGGRIYKWLHQKSNDIKIGRKITEVQAEPWGIVKEPGNSAQQLRFATLRAAKNIINPNPQETYDMGYWGSEWLAMQKQAGLHTKEHDEMIDYIQLVNRKKTA